MLKSTARSYRKSIGREYYEYEAFWKCPVCGNQNTFDEENKTTIVTQCHKCFCEVEVTYRIIKGKNY